MDSLPKFGSFEPTGRWTRQIRYLAGSIAGRDGHGATIRVLNLFTTPMTLSLLRRTPMFTIRIKTLSIATTLALAAVLVAASVTVAARPSHAVKAGAAGPISCS